MTSEQILSSSLSKAEKARKLYDLGYTRHQVADLICGGNYGWAHNIYKKHFSLETVSRSLPSVFNHKFGIEIEAYNVERSVLSQALRAAGINVQAESYNHITRRHWKIVNDASVSGSNGFELVSPVLKGNSGIEEVKKVCQVLESLRANVNKSCGFHVHFDARELSINDWKNLYKNYITLENEIDQIMPASRKGNGNQYCRSMLNKMVSKQSAFSAIEMCNTVSELSRAIANNSRYVKLNAESFMRHGTVEFRHHSGTVEFEKISNWVKICGSLIDKSKTDLVNTLSEFLPETLITYVNNRKRKLAA